MRAVGLQPMLQLFREHWPRKQKALFSSTPTSSRKWFSLSVSTPSAITRNANASAAATIARTNDCDTGLKFTPRTKLLSSLMASSGIRASCASDE